jgi:hypothetical protein
MAEPAPTTQAQAMRLAGFVTGTLLSFNAAFYFLSNLWFDDHPTAHLARIRLAFLILTLLVGGASYGAALAPRLVGHVLAIVVGVAAFCGGIGAITAGMHPTMSVTLLIVGGLAPVLAYLSLHHSRPAWSMLVSLLSVLALVTFFGAPKVRGLLHIGIWSALIAPGLMVVTVIALAMVRGEYHQD